MDIPALVAMLREGSTLNEGVSPTIYDDLLAELGTFTDSAAAKVQTLEDEKVALEREVSRLKAINFDLLSSQETPVDDDADTDTVEDVAGIDSLFGKVDD